MVCPVIASVFHSSQLDFWCGLAGPLRDDGNLCLSYLECGHPQKTSSGGSDMFRRAIDFEWIMDVYLLWMASDWLGPCGDYLTVGGYPHDNHHFLESIETGGCASLTLYPLGELCDRFKCQSISFKQIIML